MKREIRTQNDNKKQKKRQKWSEKHFVARRFDFQQLETFLPRTKC